MKRFFTCLGATMLFAGVMTPAGPERVNLRECGMDFTPKTAVKDIKTTAVQTTSREELVPLKSPQMKSSMERKSVILYEDFNNVPDGKMEQTGNIGKRYVDFIASSYYEPGNFIPNEYTPESGTWYGDWIFAGENGTVVLQSYNPMAGAFVATPLGDYSGDLTVTMRIRNGKIFWGADNEVGYSTGSGSSLDLSVMIGGYGSYDNAMTDIDSYGILSTGQIYDADGWQEVTFKFRNESANNNGYLFLKTRGTIEIDWIKVTDDNTFLASPVVNPPTDFTDNGFTINWEPVRRSFNYYIDLYKQVYTADSGLDLKYDFNDSQLPEGTSADEAQFIEGEGVDGSTALMLGYDGEGAAFETPNLGIKLTSFSTKLKFEINDEENYGASIIYDVLGENGWEPFGYLEYDGFWTTGGRYYTVALSGERFENQYYAVRFYTSDLSPENKVYIDDINAFAPRPFVLERVWDDSLSSSWDPDDDDYAYNYYDCTDGMYPTFSYTFNNLDPTTEYWYRVRSHNVLEFTIGEKHHAFGVAAPKLEAATNIGNGSYTANWIDVPKAQSYIVSNYEVVKVEEDVKEFTLMSETFSNCTGATNLEDMTLVEGNLSEFTDLYGWSGSDIIVGDHMIGSFGEHLITPPLPVNPQRGSYYIYIDALGYPDDNLEIKTLNGAVGGYLPFDEEGCLSGWIEIPTSVQGDKISFRSSYFMPFALAAFEVVQAVEAGDMVRTLIDDAVVDAGVQSNTFSGLRNDRIYAFDVVSKFELEKESVTSNSTNWMWVDIANGQSSSSLSKLKINDSDITEVARFTIDGHKVNEDYKGIVIIRMSDGSVAKKVVK